MEPGGKETFGYTLTKGDRIKKLSYKSKNGDRLKISILEKENIGSVPAIYIKNLSQAGFRSSNIHAPSSQNVFYVPISRGREDDYEIYIFMLGEETFSGYLKFEESLGHKDLRTYKVLALDNMCLGHKENMATPVRLSTDNKESITFRVIPGLANPEHVSFQFVDQPELYLTATGGIGSSLVGSPKEDNSDYKKRATFKSKTGFITGHEYYSFESLNNPGYYITRKGVGFYIIKGTDNEFKRNSTFIRIGNQWPPKFENDLNF